MSRQSCEVAGELAAGEGRDVLALASAARAADGVGPLSEQTVLDVRHGVGHHLLRYAGGQLIGYAHLRPRRSVVASELVIHPGHRRAGHGSELLGRMAGRGGRVRLWSHGDLGPARGFARAHSLRVVRELLQLSRPLVGVEDLPEPRWPHGLALRTFRPGQDERAWLEANAAAFAGHPEQSEVTLADLRARQQEPWFDPEGFFLAVDTRHSDRVAAFHWTKVEDGRERVGEVYVVGVHPAYQGMGLGRAVTLVGLRHLAALGMPRAVLYVEGDNRAALATYRGLGFRRLATDVMYALGPVVPRPG